MKRLANILLLLVSFVSIALAVFICLFNLNDHSQWISEQIEQHTGYQVSFEQIDVDLWQQPYLSVSTLSIARDKQQLMQIEKLHIAVNKISFWQRQLDIELVELSGINIDSDVLSLSRAVAENDHSTKNSAMIVPINQTLPWHRLNINKLRLNDVNADIKHNEQRLHVQHAALKADSLALINENKWLANGIKAKLFFDVQQLKLHSVDMPELRFKELSIEVDVNQQRLQGNLAVSSKQLVIAWPEQRELIVENSELALQLHRDKLLLTHFFSNVFSGEVSAQADARLVFIPRFALKQLTVQSLALQDMNLSVPSFIQVAEHKVTSSDHTLPIETVFVEKVSLQNINVSSDERVLPLTIKNLDSSMTNVYVWHESQWFTLAQKNQQAGSFTLQFDYLQWQETIIKGMDVTGQLNEDDQSLLLLKQLFTDN